MPAKIKQDKSEKNLPKDAKIFKYQNKTYVYDKKTRGYYNVANPADKISRRQFEKNFGLLKKQGFKSYEEKAKFYAQQGVKGKRMSGVFQFVKKLGFVRRLFSGKQLIKIGERYYVWVASIQYRDLEQLTNDDAVEMYVEFVNALDDYDEQTIVVVELVYSFIAYSQEEPIINSSGRFLARAPISFYKNEEDQITFMTIAREGFDALRDIEELLTSAALNVYVETEREVKREPQTTKRRTKKTGQQRLL